LTDDERKDVKEGQDEGVHDVEKAEKGETGEGSEGKK